MFRLRPRNVWGNAVDRILKLRMSFPQYAPQRALRAPKRLVMRGLARKGTGDLLQQL